MQQLSNSNRCSPAKEVQPAVELLLVLGLLLTALVGMTTTKMSCTMM
jgi:hypothetical protein